MGAVALALPRSVWRDLETRGVSVRVVVEGLTSPRVEISAPSDVAGDLRAALAWRVHAMRAQLRSPLRRAGTTLRALPELALPLLPAVTWKGWRESYGRRVFTTLTAQRPAPGLCDSCGEDLPDQTGDCALCGAARVAALRAEGLLPASAPLDLPARPTEAEWRAELVRDLPRTSVAPVPVGRWTCRVCGREVRGGADPDLECGPCEMRRVAVMSTENLGGRRSA